MVAETKLRSLTDRSQPIGRRLEWAVELAGSVRGLEGADDDVLLDILEDDRLVSAALAADLGWALCAIAASGGDSPVWAATRKMIGHQMLAAGGAGVALARLFRDGGDGERAAALLFEAFPDSADEAALWARVAARWIAAGDLSGLPGDGPAIAAALESCPELDGATLDRLLGGGWRAALDRFGCPAEAIARLRAALGGEASRWRVWVRGDGRWLEGSIGDREVAVRADGLLAVSRLEPGAELAVERAALIAALGGDPQARCWSMEPALAGVDLWTPLASTQGLRVAATLLGVPPPAIDAALELASALPSVDFGLSLIDGEPSPELFVASSAPVATAAVAGAPWLAGSHRRLASEVDEIEVRARIGARVHVEIGVAPARSRMASPPIARTGAAIALADSAAVLAGWPAARATRFREAMSAWDPPTLPGRSERERRAHARALCDRFAATGALGVPRPVDGGAVDRAERLGLRRARSGA